MCCGQKRMELKNSSPNPIQSSSPAASIASQSRSKLQMPLSSRPPGRASIATTAPARSVPPSTMTSTRASAEGEVAVRYTESSPIMVRGTASGRTYRFSAALPVQSVESRDAGALLQSRFFRRA
jgi:hypothetical protein